MGGVILGVSIPLAIWTAFRVRKDDAEIRHGWAHAGAVGVVAIGVGWSAGYGLVGLIFFPVGVLVGLADAYFKVFDGWTW
jgi:hypothetical protein